MPDTAVIVIPHPAVYPPAVPALPKLPEPLPFLSESPADQVRQISEALRRFHYGTHPGAHRYCTERPCREVAGIIRGNVL